MPFIARLICSDAACAERHEEAVASLEELDALACDCGCTWELLAVRLDADTTTARVGGVHDAGPAGRAIASATLVVVRTTT